MKRLLTAFTSGSSNKQVPTVVIISAAFSLILSFWLLVAQLQSDAAPAVDSTGLWKQRDGAALASRFEESGYLCFQGLLDEKSIQAALKTEKAATELKSEQQ